MKRKLDENDKPTVEVATAVSTENATDNAAFSSMNLDPRLLQALAKSRFSIPTPVQAQVIPLANEGKNILAKSKTGSGKTIAYALPCLQSVLSSKLIESKSKSSSVMVLVPTRELSDQVARVFTSLSQYCGKDVQTLNLTQKASEAVILAKLNEIPDVIVSTPGKVANLLDQSNILLTSVKTLVIDEADLVLSYGYEEDIEKISQAISKNVQTLLISATLSPEIDQLRQTFSQDYVKVNIEDQEEENQDLTQYVVKCGEEDKFLLLFVIFKLKLLKGKCIIFVADVDRSYRLKLYLEQFGIKSCILNSELPVNSRLHAVEEFNKGLYEILIAADDQEVIGGIKRNPKSSAKEEAGGEEEDDDEAEEASAEDVTTQKAKKLNRRKDFGVSRGIDFQSVANVVNFDLPATSRSYTHRIGRTARAGKSGTVLSFVIPTDLHGKHKYTTIPSTRHDERVLEKIRTRQAKKGAKLKDHDFNMTQVEGFRYRMHDALKAVTPNKIREARAREIRLELLKSEKLAKHFETNPEDLKALRHDTSSSAGIVRVQGHMKHVPDYLLPAEARKKIKPNDGTGTFVSFNKDDKGKRDGRRHKKGGRTRAGGPKRRDVLKSFKTRRK